MATFHRDALHPGRFSCSNARNRVLEYQDAMRRAIQGEGNHQIALGVWLPCADIFLCYDRRNEASEPPTAQDEVNIGPFDPVTMPTGIRASTILMMSSSVAEWIGDLVAMSSRYRRPRSRSSSSTRRGAQACPVSASRDPINSRSAQPMSPASPCKTWVLACSRVRSW
jgi:hypothetical protein